MTAASRGGLEGSHRLLILASVWHTCHLLCIPIRTLGRQLHSSLVALLSPAPSPAAAYAVRFRWQA